MASVDWYLPLRFLEPHQYQSGVAQLYEEITSDVGRLLPSARIEHIGASSIPGAVSKGDLDVFVGVEPEDLSKAVQLLVHNGYVVKPDTLRDESLCMLENSAHEYPVALQIVANGSEYEMFLTFRDRVRQSKSLLKEYNQMKYLCEGMSENTYREHKSAFIDKVLKSQSQRESE